MRNPFYKLESYLQDIALENKIKNHINRYHYSYRITRYIIVLTIIIYYACTLIPDISCWVLNSYKEITLRDAGAGVIAIIGLILFFIRLTKQQKQIDIQITQRVDDRFNSAISLLGSSETSARTGAIYALYELAIEEEKYRRQIAQILCSHIRSKTDEAEYQKTHSERPSNEIQTTINLLFKEEGLYAQDFAKEDEFPKANLSHAYLMGAVFTNAWCQGVNFKYAQCQRADFTNAQCKGALFMNAQCQKADFLKAQCQGALFMGAQCQGALFIGTKFRRVGFTNAQCQGALFMNAQCQEADFMEAQCQGANFRYAQCQEAKFWRAQCQGVDFTEAQCQDVNFMDAEFQGAVALESAQFGQPHDIQIKGEISDKAIKAIEDAKPYLDNSWYEKMQKIIKENKGKDPEFKTYRPIHNAKPLRK
ncbi:hypothetical protein [uncultured Gammaproteobacteria bacterium]|nr:hypothetical protein [uncultured Gammaproteobacteria bacterium]CAC9545363.1 hypothetical protein [uncultured Gammaproteobacteria bacterium]CAC9989056.1 hypothetical protein [uncultured Gammaproteobacteria bacterium]